MAQPISIAARQFIESEFFIKGVLSYDFTEIEQELIRFLTEYHIALTIQSVKTYASNRYSTDQVIKPALREQGLAKINYYPRKWKGLNRG